MTCSFLVKRWFGRAILLALIGLALLGVKRFQLDVEMLHLLPRDNPVSAGLLLYQEHFLNAGELVVTLQADEPEHAAAAVDAVVRQIRPETNLVERLFWQPPWNDSIEAPAQFLAYLWLNAPAEKVQSLHEALDPSHVAATLESTRERMTSSLNPRDFMLLPRDPFNLASVSDESSGAFETPGHFFGSEDGRFRILYLYAAVPLRNYDQCHAWVREVRAEIDSALEKAGLKNSVKAALTGRPVFVDEIASGMKSDLSTNAPGTLLMIGLLYFLVHREIRSLLLLLITLLLIMVWTALIGAAFLGQLNVISIGFASILLGLAEDFGIVLHQEAKSHPDASSAELRRIAGPGIFWSALATAAAFVLLNLSSLPGLRQLGTLVGLGILLGAWVMSYLFLPLILRLGRKATPGRAVSKPAGAPGKPTFLRLATLALLIVSGVVTSLFPPRIDPSPDVLKPRQSEASRALALVQETLGISVEPYWVIVQGKTSAEVRGKLEALEPVLNRNLAEGRISSFNLPLQIWPQAGWQQSNAPLLSHLAQRKAELLEAALQHGFTTNSFELTVTALNEWADDRPKPQWPRGRIADWMLPKFVSVSSSNSIALGLLYPTEKFIAREIASPESGALVSGWRLLGQQVFASVRREIPLISAAVLGVVLLALYFAFRAWREVALSFAVLLFSGLLLLATMSLLGWKWNLINLTSLPLLLGMGLDYSIHMQLALRRAEFNRGAVFQSIGRALLLAGSTSIIGFAILGTSSNQGMASLGQVCALGLTILLLVSVFLLPGWMPERAASGST